MDRALAELLSTTPYTAAVTEFPHSNIVLYGAGRLGKMALALLDKVGAQVACFIDRNAETLAGQFPVPVLTPAAAAAQLSPDTPIFDCVFKDKIHLAKSMLTPLGFRNIYTVNDLFLSIPEMHYTNGWHSGALTDEDKQCIAEVYEAFADDESRRAYLTNLHWRIVRQPTEPTAAALMAEDDKYFNSLTRCDWLKDTVFIDAGSFNLYFALQALDAARNPYTPASVLVLEPEPECFSLCKKIAAELPQAQQEKIVLREVALAEEEGDVAMLTGNDLASRVLHEKTLRAGVINRPATTLDALGESSPRIGYLKLHVEGEDLACLRGGTRFLAKHRPIVNINCAHNRDGLWKLMHFTMRHTRDYRYYFRAYANYGEGSTFYAVPQ